MISEKTISRLSLYHYLLTTLKEQEIEFVFSRQLANMANSTPAQVRRDLMVTGYEGNPKRGYTINELIVAIEEFMGLKEGVDMVLVGVGSLGRALLSYFYPQKPRYNIVAAFDKGSNSDRVVSGCRVYDIAELAPVLAGQRVTMGIVAVPAGAAQQVTTMLCEAGIHGILNFAPIRVKVPRNVYLENVDLAVTIEKIAWFANRAAGKKE
ncbi:redox-sensing transcriptional repressor Rex [Myxococcota bacterium]|nr:redox-sensing transcriptional repressor Rex [Myxococcota bacterium]MBU1534351.1 redox-sensing transcriptional repressor Rex [Myxococcota bacterium]